ncbi:hypothetical protein [Nostoc sp. CHAB 5715]|uniref:hypothetical protein n=1 Tax=Nostoc sp. CHAB 5715 TaxID=2780400 RepID=UPI001E49E133|nr:hypothetical protein [Nostoc sp. CHAB 5715]MCC5625982.1 hypothetical protein [Nostoc sp. CHAB 5715]
MKCNQLAFDTYSQMMRKACLVNEYATNQTSKRIPPPKSWQELIHYLECACLLD